MRSIQAFRNHVAHQSNAYPSASAIIHVIRGIESSGFEGADSLYGDAGSSGKVDDGDSLLFAHRQNVSPKRIGSDRAFMAFSR
jgi:hypothetical protein